MRANQGSVPRARQRHLFLQAAAAAGGDERLGALEAVVSGDHGTGEVAGRGPASQPVTMPT
jgi:hypothetical protein